MQLPFLLRVKPGSHRPHLFSTIHWKQLSTWQSVSGANIGEQPPSLVMIVGTRGDAHLVQTLSPRHSRQFWKSHTQ